jgi:L-ascorbate metabolism protein UlaG (beta-lactamase superfamily)
MAILISLLSLGVIFILASIAIDRLMRSSGYVGPQTDHFDGKKFFNYVVQFDERVRKTADESVGRGSFLKWILNRPKNPWAWRKALVPLVRERVEGTELVMTYINHTTVLIQTAGLNIITDPIWAYRASPIGFMGPRRYQEAGMKLQDLPPIDLVLVSHNHYDHMDLGALRQISKKWKPKIYCPLGNAAFLARKGIPGARDMDWWQSQVVTDALTLDCVPAQHFASRAISDRNKTLWCGFILRVPAGLIYFAGDTGYGPFAKRIAEKYKNISWGLIPIGAYKPEWFMSEVHVSPDEAVRIHTELGIKTSIATHFGTFSLADDTQDEAVRRIETILTEEQKKGNQIDFRILYNGGQVSFL